MNWKAYCELRKPIDEAISEEKKKLSKLDKLYIDEHAEFEKGTHVIIRAKKTMHAVVTGYDINENGRCVPRLLLMTNGVCGKKSFFHQHEFDESIVIERCDE